MKIIKPSYQIITEINRKEVLEHLERIGRTCYKSEDNITEDSASNFVSMLINRGHEAMIEHFNISVRFICNRGFTHELVRHRIASYAQESTRYCNYKDNFTVIQPANFNNWNNDAQVLWRDLMLLCEHTYNVLIHIGLTPQDARGVLPIDIKTEIVITANLREWRAIFKLRANKHAHPSMQQLMYPLQKELHELLPEIFNETN